MPIFRVPRLSPRGLWLSRLSSWRRRYTWLSPLVSSSSGVFFPGSTIFPVHRELSLFWGLYWQCMVKFWQHRKSQKSEAEYPQRTGLQIVKAYEIIWKSSLRQWKKRETLLGVVVVSSVIGGKWHECIICKCVCQWVGVVLPAEDAKLALYPSGKVWPRDEIPRGEIPRGEIPRGEIPRGEIPRGEGRCPRFHWQSSEQQISLPLH